MSYVYKAVVATVEVKDGVMKCSRCIWQVWPLLPKCQSCAVAMRRIVR